jgi:hypothetical protein
MSLQQIEFRFPPFKFSIETAAADKKYFKRYTSKITNVAIETSDGVKKTYKLDTISVVSGGALMQPVDSIYLVTKNISIKDLSTHTLYLCFKLDYGKEGLDVFNSTTGIEKIDIGSAMYKAPSNTVSISDNKQIIIVDCPVHISKPPLVSKYFNIIENTSTKMNTQTLDKVTHVLTTASCKPKSASGLTEKQALITHGVMIILSFLVIVGAWVGKTTVAPNISLINTVLFVFWFLLVVIVYSLVDNPKKLNKTALGQTALITKYLVFIIASVLTIFNQQTLMDFILSKDVFDSISKIIFPATGSTTKRIFALVIAFIGAVLTFLLYVV